MLLAALLTALLLPALATTLTTLPAPAPATGIPVSVEVNPELEPPVDCPAFLTQLEVVIQCSAVQAGCQDGHSTGLVMTIMGLTTLCALLAATSSAATHTI